MSQGRDVAAAAVPAVPTTPARMPPTSVRTAPSVSRSPLRRGPRSRLRTGLPTRLLTRPVTRRTRPVTVNLFRRGFFSRPAPCAPGDRNVGANISGPHRRTCEPYGRAREGVGEGEGEGRTGRSADRAVSWGVSLLVRAVDRSGVGDLWGCRSHAFGELDGRSCGTVFLRPDEYRVNTVEQSRVRKQKLCRLFTRVRGDAGRDVRPTSTARSNGSLPARRSPENP